MISNVGNNVFFMRSIETTASQFRVHFKMQFRPNRFSLSSHQSCCLLFHHYINFLHFFFSSSHFVIFRLLSLPSPLFLSWGAHILSPLLSLSHTLACHILIQFCSYRLLYYHITLSFVFCSPSRHIIPFSTVFIFLPFSIVTYSSFYSLVITSQFLSFPSHRLIPFSNVSILFPVFLITWRVWRSGEFDEAREDTGALEMDYDEVEESAGELWEENGY